MTSGCSTTPFPSPARRPRSSRDDIYRCAAIPVRVRGTDGEGRRWDYAFVELDRPVVPPRRAAPLAEAPLAAGPGQVSVIGFPGGLPGTRNRRVGRRARRTRRRARLLHDGQRHLRPKQRLRGLRREQPSGGRIRAGGHRLRVPSRPRLLRLAPHRGGNESRRRRAGRLRHAGHILSLRHRLVERLALRPRWPAVPFRPWHRSAPRPWRLRHRVAGPRVGSERAALGGGVGSGDGGACG